jgi:hypothetical protein
VGADCGGAVSDNPARLLALKAAAIFLNTRDWSVEQLEREFRKTLHEQPSPPAVPDAERVDTWPCKICGKEVPCGCQSKPAVDVGAVRQWLVKGEAPPNWLFDQAIAALDQQQREIEQIQKAHDIWAQNWEVTDEELQEARADLAAARKAERNTRAEWEGSLGTYPDGDDVPNVVALNAMTRELVADLASAKAQNHEWLVCNGPGGWIDDLRKDLAAAKATAAFEHQEAVKALAALAQAEQERDEARALYEANHG